MKLDNEGYLVDPADWTEQVAQEFAALEGITLGEDHWALIRFMRAYYEDNALPADTRFAIRFLAEERGYGAGARRRLFELFPYGYVKQACRIAGMRRPRIWSTG